MYKLIWMDFFVSLFVTFFIEYPRGYVFSHHYRYLVVFIEIERGYWGDEIAAPLIRTKTQVVCPNQLATRSRYARALKLLEQCWISVVYFFPPLPVCRKMQSTHVHLFLSRGATYTLRTYPNSSPQQGDCSGGESCPSSRHALAPVSGSLHMRIIT